MDRGTLAWYRCDVCGRKGPVFECSIAGVGRITLCRYCALALAIRVRVSCPGLGLGSSRVALRRVEADDLLSRVETGLRSQRRGRRARRSGARLGG